LQPIVKFAYYLLGWNNEQFAVYYGAEYEPAVQTINCAGGGTANITSTGPRTVLMWNAEYNTYGNGSNINLTYKYDQGGTWKKYYNINDHLGNVRTVLRQDETEGKIVKQFDYAPFGAVLNSTDINRIKLIGKEKDKESNYADHGVRKYDDEIGRFTSIDPLWEKYYSLTPYQYAGNNPVSFLDGNGKEIFFPDNSFSISEQEAIREYIDLMEQSSDPKARELAKRAKSDKTKINIYGVNGKVLGKNSGIFIPDFKINGGDITFNLSSFRTETIAHELWHFMQSQLKPLEFLRFSNEDENLKWEERRIEKGCDSFEGAIDKGKRIDYEIEQINRNSYEKINDKIIRINDKNPRER